MRFATDFIVCFSARVIVAGKKGVGVWLSGSIHRIEAVTTTVAGKDHGDNCQLGVVCRVVGIKAGSVWNFMRTLSPCRGSVIVDSY